MATWADMEGLRWADLDRLTWRQIETWSSDVWELLRSLEPAERTALLEGIKDGSLPPALLAAGGSQYDRVESAALSLFTRYAPKDASQMAAYLAVLVSLLTVLTNQGSDPAPPMPPPAQVIVVELPPQCRPTEQPPSGDMPKPPEPPTTQSR
ncbi:MAG TPA: hypothetical protein VNA20_10385 [Frankiaceae bacterium]|nr:hypothetical protein [Frankiaceae bacterium]